MRLLFFVILLFWVSFTTVRTQVPSRLIYDNYQSQFFGAENIITAHKTLYEISDKGLPAKLGSENTLLKKAGSVGYRFLKLALLDFQIDFMLALTQHEVFGHGSRMRGLDYENISYELRPFFPYGKGGGWAAGSGKNGSVYSMAQRMSVGFGGNEGNFVLADNLESRLLLNNKIHYRQGLLFLIARNNLLYYVGQNHLGEPYGDVETYLERLNNGQSIRPYPIKKLFTQSLITLLNPLQFYAAWSVGKNFLLNGETSLSIIPSLSLGNWKYLPSFNFNLTPFGSEFLVNQYFTKDNRLFNFQLRWGESTFHTHYGLGVEALNLLNSKQFNVHAQLALWQQPSFEIGGDAIKEIGSGLGGMLQLSGEYFPFSHQKKVGLYGLLGFKTAGYILGEELDQGLMARFGLAIDFE